MGLTWRNTYTWTKVLHLIVMIATRPHIFRTDAGTYFRHPLSTNSVENFFNHQHNQNDHKQWISSLCSVFFFSFYLQRPSWLILLCAIFFFFYSISFIYLFIFAVNAAHYKNRGGNAVSRSESWMTRHCFSPANYCQFRGCLIYVYRCGRSLVMIVSLSSVIPTNYSTILLKYENSTIIDFNCEKKK